MNLYSSCQKVFCRSLVDKDVFEKALCTHNLVSDGINNEDGVS